MPCSLLTFKRTQVNKLDFAGAVGSGTQTEQWKKNYQLSSKWGRNKGNSILRLCQVFSHKLKTCTQEIETAQRVGLIGWLQNGTSGENKHGATWSHNLSTRVHSAKSGKTKVNLSGNSGSG